MILYISNFKKILLGFLILFIGYNIVLIVLKPNIIMFQNTQQKNTSFSQDFIYEEKTTNIIVGSSMAARMENKFLSKDLFNLSFSGGSVLTGLEIIKRSKFIPDNIYIENNIIFRAKDIKFINKLFYPVWWKIKYLLPALREKYQPLTVLISIVKETYGKSHLEYMKSTRNNKIYIMNLKKHMKNYNMPLRGYSNQLDDLKNLVKYFESKGTRVFFFEMPIAQTLANSLKAKEQRSIILHNFKNSWLKLPDNKKYTTSDGIHLLYKSAYEYSLILQQRMKIHEE